MKAYPQHAKCLVLEMRQDGRIPGKHASHPAHSWWYTSWGGGHQLANKPEPGDIDYNTSSEWWCPGE